LLVLPFVTTSNRNCDPQNPSIACVLPFSAVPPPPLPADHLRYLCAAPATSSPKSAPPLAPVSRWYSYFNHAAGFRVESRRVVWAPDPAADRRLTSPFREPLDFNPGASPAFGGPQRHPEIRSFVCTAPDCSSPTAFSHRLWAQPFPELLKA